MRPLEVAALLVAAAASRAAPCAQDEPSPPPPPLPLPTESKPTGSTAPLAPTDEAATFRLPPEFAVELVAAEPLVVEPVMCVFDGDGRPYVAEMRTYMQDLDAGGENEPRSQVALLHDDDGDGRMDRRTTFADGLVLPRLLLPLYDGVLIGETYTTELYLYRDTDGDGVADDRTLWRRGNADNRNLEHQDSALTFGIDGWFYTAMSGERLRLVSGVVQSEPVASEFAQWGLAVDDVGRQFFCSAGGERPAYNFQRHPRYGKVSFGGELADDFAAVYPAIATPDVQGGTGRLRADGSLDHFTGCCGPSIYRGDALPADCRGDYIVCEPVGRLVRRASVRDVDGKIVLENRYPQAEFWTSTDMNFRPVWSATGPDGGLWVVDMYRGIIQEGNWTREDSYLRPQIERLGLQANVGRGRIWRVLAKGRPPRPTLHLQHASADELVAALAHENGFWRDTAEKLLVLRGEVGVEPTLRALLASDAEPLARLHALWTLVALDRLQVDDLVAGLRDADPRLRQAAVRASEPHLVAAGRDGALDPALAGAMEARVDDPDVQVAIQLALSLRYATQPAARSWLLALAGRWRGQEVVERAVSDSLTFGCDGDQGGATGLTGAALDLVREGKTHYELLCIACHGGDGRGVRAGDVALAPSLQDSPRVHGSPDALLRIVLHGMSGPIDGRVYGAGMMLPQAAQGDRYVAAVLSYVRTVFAGGAGVIEPTEVAAVRAACGVRNVPWTQAELAPYMALPQATIGAWKAAASDGDDSAHQALDGDAGTRFTTGTPMRPDMWWRVDLDGEYEVTSIVLDTTGSRDDFPRGYVLETSLDGETWNEVARGEGDGPRTVVTLPPGRLRHFRFTQTGRNEDQWWSIHRISVCGRRI
ncbi:MAG: discoidin domain-containing protein [Planctomycetota bacterium]